MCRHAAYVGPGTSISSLFELPHGLEHQSFAARELLTGVVCADGFGVGWYDGDTRPEPGRYANPMPVWSDKNIQQFGPIVHSPLMVAAVRNATIAGSNTEANCAPFADGRYLLSHNGYLEDFEASWRETMSQEWIAPQRIRHIRGNTDSEFLFQALLSRHDESEAASSSLPTAIQSLLQDIGTHAKQTGKDAYVNLLVADGVRLIATRYSTNDRVNSLYYLPDGDQFPGAHVVASEPLYDDPLWEPVAPNAILVLSAYAPPVRLQA